MTFGHLRSFICFAILAYCALPASAAILYTANFDNAADISGWTINVAPTVTAANQGAITGFNYGAFGIPAAPGNAVADTFGMRLRANVPGGDAAPVTTRPNPTPNEASGLSVSPTGGNFGANFGMTFWAWSNFNGSANASGLADNANSQGGTNNIMFGIGTSGTVPLAVGNTGLLTNGQMDGVGFATTGDGGITNDYRIYPASGTILPAANPAYMAASNSNTAAYYQAVFGTHAAPAVQLALSTAEFNDGANNTQAGLTQAGAFGFAWHRVDIAKNNNIVTWSVDGSLLAYYDASALSLGGNNIALGQSDVNGSPTRHPSLLFTVYDNLTVYEIPEPASCTLVALGLAAIGLISRRRSV